MRLTSNWGFLLLAIWLILTGLITLFDLIFSGINLLMGILALVAGLLILMER